MKQSALLHHQQMAGYGQIAANSGGLQQVTNTEWQLLENGPHLQRHQTQAWPWLKDRVAANNQVAAAVGAGSGGPQAAAALSALLLGLKNSTAASSDNVAPLFQAGQVCCGPAPFVISSYWDS